MKCSYIDDFVPNMGSVIDFGRSKLDHSTHSSYTYVAYHMRHMICDIKTLRNKYTMDEHSKIYGSKVYQLNTKIT